MNKGKWLALFLPVLFFTMGCSSLTRPEIPPSATSSQTSTPPVIATNAAASYGAADFAESILIAMKDRPPDYQDDFNNLSSGWTIADNADYLDGEVGYMDGEYFIIADPLTDLATAPLCAWGENSDGTRYADFLAEFDIKFVSGKEGNWGFQFHRTFDKTNGNETKYSAGGNYLGGVFFNKCNPDPDTNCPVLKEISDGSLILGTDWVHIQVMARGAKMGLYVDGKPALYVEDPQFTDAYNQGEFILGLCNFANLPMEVRWDNLRVWDITGLP